MKDDVRETAKGVEELRMGQEGKESCFNLFPQLYVTLSRVIFSAQKTRDIMNWISTLNFATKQNDFFGRRQKGTGKWLLEDDVFKSWLDGTVRILWCPGLRMISH